MASRFWVGGTGSWTAINLTSWSATSGGSGGATVPGAGDDVTFDAASGGGVVTVGAAYNPSVNSITMGAFTGTLDFSANNNSPTIGTFSGSGTGTRTLNMGSGTWTLTGSSTSWNLNTTTNLIFSGASATILLTGVGVTFNGGVKTYGAVTFSGGGTMLISNSVNTFASLTIIGTAVTTDIMKFSSNNIVSGTFTVTGNSAVNTIAVSSNVAGNTQSVTFNNGNFTNIKSWTNISLNMSGTGNTWTLSEPLNLAGTSITTLTLTAGTLNANNFNVTCGAFSSSNTNTRILTMGSGNWTLTGTGTVWNTATTTNLTLNKGTATINPTDSSSLNKTLIGGGKTFYRLLYTQDRGFLTLNNIFFDVIRYTGNRNQAQSRLPIATTRKPLAQTRLTIRDFGTALQNDGSSSNSVVVTRNASLNFSTTGFTLSCWVKRNEKTLASKRFIYKRSGNSGFLIQTRSDGSIEAAVGNGTTLPLQAFVISPTKSLNWNFLAIVCDLTKYTTYLNGLQVSTGALAGMADATSTDLSFLSDNIAGGVSGKIDSIKLFNRPFSDNEILNLYQNGSFNTLGLVGNWLFNEGSGLISNDSSGNGNNGVNTGVTYTTDVPNLSRIRLF